MSASVHSPVHIPMCLTSKIIYTSELYFKKQESFIHHNGCEFHQYMHTQMPFSATVFAMPFLVHFYCKQCHNSRCLENIRWISTAVIAVHFTSAKLIQFVLVYFSLARFLKASQSPSGCCFPRYFTFSNNFHHEQG